MVSVLARTVVERGIESLSGQTKDYKIVCYHCLSAKHTALRRKNNVSEWSDMFIRGLFFQWASAIKIQLIEN